MTGTMATGKRQGGGTLCVVLCIVVLFLGCIMDAAAATDTNSSRSTSTDDGSGGSSSESTMEKGMKPFFDMVKGFLVVVQPHKISDQTWLNLSAIVSTSGNFQMDEFSDWKNWATYLIGFCVLIAIGVLFFIVMPIVGLCFCCCRCCGKCGGKHKPHDPKRAGCKRSTYCTLLLLLNTVALAGVVCAFLSNELIYHKLQNKDNLGPVGKLTSTIDHIEGYVNSTVDEVEETVLGIFDRNRYSIIRNIRNTANNAVDEILRILNATALLDQAKDLSREVNQTRDQLANVADQLALLSSEGDSLAGNLTEIASGVLDVCNLLAGAAECNGFNSAEYIVSANFSRLDKLSTEANNVAKSLDMSAYITEAEEVIAHAKNQTTADVDSSINGASGSIDDVRAQIVRGINDVRSTVGDVTKSMQSATGRLKDAQPDLTKYSKYWWYGGLAVSCLLLLVVVFYYLGVLFGLCGERPGLGAQCCNTGTGANFLMAGVGFTFIFGWLIMLVCIILFATGGPFYTEVCRYFDGHDPNDLKPFETALLRASDLTQQLYGDKDVTLSVLSILSDCKEDKSVYDVMKLDNMVNLTTVTDLEPLEVKLDILRNRNLNIPNVTIVNDNLKRTISDFAGAGLDNIPFAEYYEEVNKNLTAGNLGQMGRNLRSIAYQSNVVEPYRSQLLVYAERLRVLEDGSVLQMKDAVRRLNESLNYLDANKGAVQPKALALLAGLQDAEANFNTQKNNLVVARFEEVVNSVLDLARRVVNDILYKVRHDIGKCRPVYDAFYSATDAACVVVLDPVNGFWFSLGWCLFFFVPSLIFAVKLAGLYRREHDEKDFDDPNYIMYGGGHQDTIPLTSRERGHHAAPYPGMANSAYRQDSYPGPGDKYAPPPYGASHNGMGSGEMTPPPYTRERWGGPGLPYGAQKYPVYPGDGATTSGAL